MEETITKKICSNCGKTLQIIRTTTEREESIESFEIMWWQKELLYFCADCHKLGEKNVLP
jgi:hypothetical protein